MNCQWQIGLLVLRTCGQPATGGCSFCGSAICAAHTMPGSDGPACPRCAGSHHGYETTEEAKLARERDRYYDPYGGAANYGEEGYFTGTEGAAMGASTYVDAPVVKKKYDPKDS